MGKVAWSWSSLKCTGALCPSSKAGLCHRPRVWLVGVWLGLRGLKEEQDQKESKPPCPGFPSLAAFLSHLENWTGS